MVAKDSDDCIAQELFKERKFHPFMGCLYVNHVAVGRLTAECFAMDKKVFLGQPLPFLRASFPFPETFCRKASKRLEDLEALLA